MPGITTPFGGPRYQAAVAALTAAGRDLTFANIRDFIGTAYPTTVSRDAQGNPVTILAQPNDPSVNFIISTPFNSDLTAAVDGFEFAVQHNFWDTASARSSTTRSSTATGPTTTAALHRLAIAITGLSDSANAVLFFDKYGINARAAYNWRKGYLAGAGTNPVYVNTYGQLDGTRAMRSRQRHDLRRGDQHIGRESRRPSALRPQHHLRDQAGCALLRGRGASPSEFPDDLPAFPTGKAGFFLRGTGTSGTAPAAGCP